MLSLKGPRAALSLSGGGCRIKAPARDGTIPRLGPAVSADGCCSIFRVLLPVLSYTWRTPQAFPLSRLVRRHLRQLKLFAAVIPVLFDHKNKLLMFLFCDTVSVCVPVRGNRQRGERYCRSLSLMVRITMVMSSNWGTPVAKSLTSLKMRSSTCSPGQSLALSITFFSRSSP